MSTEILSREQAQAAYDAVRARYAAYFVPVLAEDGRVIANGWPVPVLRQRDDGHWLIEWEEGPDDWAYQASAGGSTEEERVLTAAAADEFNAPGLRAPEPPPITWPPGVEVEPDTSYSLGLYPA